MGDGLARSWKKKSRPQGVYHCYIETEYGADNEKGRLRIIHGNYQRPLKTATSEPLVSQARILSSLLFVVIELRLLRYNYRKRTVKIIVDIQFCRLFCQTYRTLLVFLWD